MRGLLGIGLWIQTTQHGTLERSSKIDPLKKYRWPTIIIQITDMFS